MPRKNITKREIASAILTDTLPYEVPINFSNDGYHKRILANDFSELTTLLLHCSSAQDYVPYNFSIRKDKTSNRTLSVPHPAIQREISEFYTRNEQIFVNLCSRSEYSLRHPANVATTFYEKDYRIPSHCADSDIETECVGDVSQSEYASTYFVYRKYGFIHKFIESDEFHRLERRFSTLCKCDISKCFPSIYTHTISWAVKSKQYAKKNRKVMSFENSLDKLMSRANDSETHGIIVGPEFSRIFSEIILQRIDQKILEKLNTLGYIHDFDYAIRRYVDDYFVFSNNKDVLEKILITINTELEYYKLYTNSSKTELAYRPFSSPITTAKNKISEFENTLFRRTWGRLIKYSVNSGASPQVEQLYSHKKSPSSNRLIVKFKTIVFETGVEFSKVSRYTLSVAHKKLHRYHRRIEGVLLTPTSIDLFFHSAMTFLDFVFFVYSLDVNVRTTYTVSRILLLLCKFVERFPADNREDLHKRIFDEIKLLLSYARAGTLPQAVELSNLLITYKALASDDLIPLEDILQSLNLSDFNTAAPAHGKTIDYFSLITFLTVSAGNIRHASALANILDHVFHRYERTESVRHSTELTCMFFDLISCPYVPQTFKQKLVGHVLRITKQVKCVRAATVASEIAYISRHTWFTDWNVTSQIDDALHKKEIRTPY